MANPSQYDTYTLPNGKKIYFEQGTSDDVVTKHITKKYGDLYTAPKLAEKEDPSFFGRLGASASQTLQQGVQSIVPGAEAGAALLNKDEEAWDAAQARLAKIKEEAYEINPDPSSFAEVKQKFADEGILSAAGETLDLTAQSIGSTIGFVFPSALVVGGATLAAGAMTPAGAAVTGGAALMAKAGIVGGAATMFSQVFGSQIERAYQNGEASVEDVNLATQMASAAGQTALESVTPIALGYLGKSFTLAAKAGSPLFRRAANQSVANATLAFAKRNLGTAASKYMQISAVEAATEVGQSALERAAAGESISLQDEEAMNEYIESFVGGVLGSAPFAGHAGYRNYNQQKNAVAEIKQADEYKKDVEKRFEEDANRRIALDEKQAKALATRSAAINESLSQKAEETAKFLDLEEENRVSREVEEIRGADRTDEDIKNVAASRNIDINSTPEARAGYNRIVAQVAGSLNPKKMTPSIIDSVYNRLSVAGTQPESTALPLTDSTEVFEIAREIAKDTKGGKPESKVQLSRRVKKILSRAEGGIFGDQALLDIRTKAVIDSIEASGLLLDKVSGLYANRARKPTPKFSLDTDVIDFMSDPDVNQVASATLYIASKSVIENTLPSGKVNEVVGLYPTFEGVKEATGLPNEEDYLRIRTALTKMGLLNKKGNRYFYSGVPDILANRREYTASGVKQPRWIVRDADGVVRHIATSRAKAQSAAKEMRETDPDVKLQAPTKEQGHVIKESQYNEDGRLVKAFPVEFVEDAPGALTLAAERVAAFTELDKKSRDEYLGTDTVGVKSELDPAAARLARSSEKKDRDQAKETLKRSPFREEAVINRYAYPTEGTVAANIHPVEGVESASIPFDVYGRKGESVPVFVKEGILTDEGRGFGAARMDANAPGWREHFKGLMSKIAAEGQDAFNSNGLSGWADKAGRTIIVDGIGKDARYYVFDYIDDDGNPSFHLYNSFTGDQSYAENAEDLGPLMGIPTKRGEGASAGSIRAANDPNHSSVDKLTPAEREAREIGYDLSDVERQAEFHGVRTPPPSKGLFSFVNDWAERHWGKDALGRLRYKTIDTKDPFEAREKNIYDVRTGEKLYTDTSAMSIVRLYDRVQPMAWAALTEGFIRAERLLNPDGSWDGQIEISTEKMALENSSGPILVADKNTGEYVTREYTSDLYNLRNNNETGGYLTILQSLSPGKVAKLMQARRAFRAYNLLNEDPKAKVPIRKEQINEYMKYFDDADIAVANNNLNQWNEHLVDYLVETGVLSEDMRTRWLRNSDYVSFQRDFEGDSAWSERMKAEHEALGLSRHQLGDLGYRLPSKAIKGFRLEKGQETEDALLHPIEAQMNNMLAGLASGVAFQARGRILRNEIANGTARRVVTDDDRKRVKAKEKLTVKHRENGKDLVFELDDPLIFEALESNWGFNILDKWRNHPFLKWITTMPPKVLRETVTRNPGFMIPNQVRDATIVWIVNGGDPSLVAKSFKRTAQNIWFDATKQDAKISESFRELRKRGTVGGYEHVDIAGGPKEATQGILNVIDHDTVDPRNPIVRAWNVLGRYSAYSEAATRELVYEDVLVKAKKRLEGSGLYDTKTTAGNRTIEILADQEATYQAKEILNFSRHGSSIYAQAIAALAPFLNARVQGMDVIGRAAFGYRDAGTDQSVSHEERQAGMMRRGMFIASISAALAIANMDDEDYENQNGYIRDENWLIRAPGFDGTFIAIPTPFELGFFFKTIPEQIVRSVILAARGEENQAMRDSRRAAVQFAFGTFGPGQAIPVAIRPFAEGFANRSIHTGNPIESQWEQDLPSTQRFDEKTTAQARLIGKATGLVGFGPKKVDNIIRTVLGGLGAHGWATLDTLLRAPAAITSDWPVPVKPLPSATDIVAIRRLVKTGEGAGGALIEFYDYRQELREADAIVRAASDPKEERRLKKKYREELKALRKLRPVDRRLRKLRKDEAEVRANEGHKRTAREIAKEIQKIHEKRKAPIEDFRKQRARYDQRS